MHHDIRACRLDRGPAHAQISEQRYSLPKSGYTMTGTPAKHRSVAAQTRNELLGTATRALLVPHPRATAVLCQPPGRSMRFSPCLKDLFITTLFVLSVSFLWSVMSLRGDEASDVTKHAEAAPPAKPKPTRKYPTGIPNKFTPNGTVQPFRGNTFVMRLPSTSPMYTSLLGLYVKLQKSEMHKNHLYVLLPPESWHVTVFEGVTDKVRRSDKWASDLALDTPLDEMTQILAERVQAAHEHLSEDAQRPFKVAFGGWKPFASGIGMYVRSTADTPGEEVRLRRLRDGLSEATHLRFPDHENYSFHLTVAYLLRHLTDLQKRDISAILEAHELPDNFDLDPPEFCSFERITTFKREFYLS